MQVSTYVFAQQPLQLKLSHRQCLISFKQVFVWKCVNGSVRDYLTELCCCVPIASASGRQHLSSASTGLYYKFPGSEPRSTGGASLLRDHLCCQSSRCYTEIRDDSAHLQETTAEGLPVPHLMCWRTEEKFATAWRCCGVLVILAPDTKLQTYLLTYLLTSRVHRIESMLAAGQVQSVAVRFIFTSSQVVDLLVGLYSVLRQTPLMRCWIGVSDYTVESGVRRSFVIDRGGAHTHTHTQAETLRFTTSICSETALLLRDRSV